MKANRLRAGAVTLLVAASLTAGAQETAWTPEARQRLLEGLAAPSSAVARQRLALALEAEQRMAVGDTTAAQAALDSLAGQLHSPDVELALVRNDMQAGEYRRALNSVAHAAGAHLEVSTGTALYAWLLQLGGQGAVASRTLAQALESAPHDAVLLETRSALAAPWPLPGPLLLSAPGRFAPYAFDLDGRASGGGPAAAAVASATLASDGRHAYVPRQALDGAVRIQVRNGLGQTVSAVVDPSLAHPGLALLTLGARLPTAPGQGRVTSSPYAGGPAYMVEYAPDPAALPAWPVLRPGFFGRLLLLPGDRLLGIDAPPGPRGGPVFDASGRLAGIACPGLDQRDHLVSILELEDAANAVRGVAPAPAPEKPAALPIDGVYEAALRTALQVLVTR